MTTPTLLPGIPADLHYAILFSPRPCRPRLIALANLGFEIRDVLRECRDPGIAETKLRWWEEEISLMTEGKARHPLAQAFSRVNAEYLAGIGSPLQNLLDSVRQDIAPPSFPDYTALLRYCERRGGAFTELTARLCDAYSSEACHAARQLGCASQLADIVVLYGVHTRLGRNYFANEDLRHHHVDQHVVDGVHTDGGLKALLADYSRRAHELAHTPTEPAARPNDHALIPARVLAGLALARLDRFARRDFAAAHEPVELPALHALWTAWSSARHLP